MNPASLARAKTAWLSAGRSADERKIEVPKQGKSLYELAGSDFSEASPFSTHKGFLTVEHSPSEQRDRLLPADPEQLDRKSNSWSWCFERSRRAKSRGWWSGPNDTALDR